MSRAAVLFAQGLEECEGLIVVDLLRRAKIETDIVSLDEREEIISSHNVSIRADCSFDHTDFGQYDVIVLPGGMPGTRNLQQDSRVLSVISDFYQKGKLIAAICAAPVILETAGILSGKEATVHHKFTEELVSAQYVSQEVVSDRNIITAWGLGAAIPFGLSIVERCCGLHESERIRKAIGYIH